MQDTVELTYGEFWAMAIPSAILYVLVLMDMLSLIPVIYRSLRMRFRQRRYRKKLKKSRTI